MDYLAKRLSIAAAACVAVISFVQGGILLASLATIVVLILTTIEERR